MANDQQTQERNDPAIDPDTDMGQTHAPEQPQSGQSQSSGAQSQDNQGAQSQANDGNRSGESSGEKGSEENSYTPDFEPEEHESPDKTKEKSQTGETDADIDTAGG